MSPMSAQGLAISLLVIKTKQNERRASRTSSESDVVTAFSEQVFGKDRVGSEAVGCRVAHVELGHKQRIAANLRTHIPKRRLFRHLQTP